MTLIAPLINGHRYSYSSIEIAAQIGVLPIEIFTDVSSISYDESLDIAFVKGTSRSPIGWTAGDYKPGSAELKMGKSSQTEMVTQIGPGWLGINLIMQVAYADIGESLTVDTLIARINKIADSHDSGPDSLSSSVGLQLFTILRNGIPPMLNRVY